MKIPVIFRRRSLSLAILSFAVALAFPVFAQTGVARTVKYSQQDVIAVRAKLRYSTLIVLPQNEDILDFATGDKDFWIINGAHNLCYVHPAQAGIRSDLHLITASGHVYSFLLTEISSEPSVEPDLKLFVEPKEESSIGSKEYTKRTLSQYKRRHEKWIKQATGLSPERKTALIVFIAPIGKQTVSIPYDQMLEAVAPRYPISREGLEIDLTNLLEENSSVNAVAMQNIVIRLSRYFEPKGEWQRTGHLSIFALGPMPLLIFLGSQLSNKISTDLYQRHRDNESWTWRKSGLPVRYKFSRIREGSDYGRVALLLCLSGSGPRENLPSHIDSTYFVYELTLDGITASPTFLSLREDLENFRIAYQGALAEIAKVHGSLKELNLFPAVPAPVAVLCGRETLPKIHPALRVYDYDKAKGGFEYQLTVNA